LVGFNPDQHDAEEGWGLQHLRLKPVESGYWGEMMAVDRQRIKI